MTKEMRSVIAFLTSVSFAVLGVLLLREILSTLQLFLKHSNENWLFSRSLAEPGLQLVLVVTCTPANRAMAKWARSSRGIARTLYWLQTWGLVAAVATFVVGSFAFVADMHRDFLMALLSDAMAGVEFIVTALLLLAFALQTRRTLSP